MHGFDDAMDLVARWEGGWSDHAADPGGKTKWGITIKTVRAKALDFNRDGRHTVADLRAMTRDQARRVYREDYWSRTGCDELPPPVALLVFNAAVNQGARRAVTFLQRAAGATPDGIFGPKTRAAALQAWAENPRRLLREVLTRQMLHYTSLSIFATFGKGWTRRTFDVAMTAAAWRTLERSAFAPGAGRDLQELRALVSDAAEILDDALEVADA